MMSAPKITFIGAGSTIFVKNILGDVFHREALKTAHIALMDIDPTRLEESHIVVRKLMDSAGASGKITCHTQQKEALQDADFVVVAFQIGGYEPCTVTDFEVCKRHGLEQTIADTLGPGGIMRALRTIPHLWQICEDMTEVCPDATMLNYVNPMAMNTWAMYARYPHIKQVGLCHSVQGTAEELARDLNIDPATLRYRCAGINHMAFYLELERKIADGSYVNLYPELLAAYDAGQAPKPNIHGNTRCQNIVRYEMFKKLGYFVTESSEHFAEYTPWFIKPGREDLIERYKVPLDGINHMAFYLELERKIADGSYVNLYPELLAAYDAGQAPKPNIHGNTRCQNIVRYEMFKKLGYFVTESSEHFAEYTPWFIKPGREDLIERYKVPLDEYPKRCVEQLANWHKELEEYKNASRIDIKPSREYASTIMNAIWTGEPSVIYGNVRNDGLIDNLPQGCCVEVACLVDANGIQPTKVGTLPSHLAALMQTNINVQTLLTEAILTENRDRVYHAAMMDPHTAAVLGIDEIYALVDDLIAAHGDWLPGWLHR